LQTLQQKWFFDQTGENGISTESLSESTNGASALGVERFGSSRIADISFVFDVSKMASDITFGDGFHRLPIFIGHEASANEEPIILEGIQFILSKLFCRGMYCRHDLVSQGSTGN